MPFVIVALTLFAVLMVADADAQTDAERLAKMFSPILVLTEDTGGKWGDIEVLTPEPVEIMGAQSAENIWFSSRDLNGKERSRITQGLSGDYNPPINLETVEANCPKVDFSANKFAFLTSDCYASYDRIHPNGVAFSGYVYPDHFNYPGETPEEWNNTYLGTGKYAGEEFPHTAYVHIWETTNSNYDGPITVIKYLYFYPYNHWWNRHEGDWQGINVVVSSSDPDDDTIEVLGVEYSFHKAHLSYYKNYFHRVYHGTELEATLEMPGLASSFVFNPQDSLKLSQGTHPVVYVGAGSHASYPFGGKIFLNGSGDGSDGRDPTYEYMTHTGKVLSTQADGSHRDLWESYKLVMLPENLPNPTKDDNMGLTGTTEDMSWLGADILWGTPVVSSPHSDPNLGLGNIFIVGLLKGPSGNMSPRGPYHAGWKSLKFFKQGFTGGSWWIFDFTYPFSYKDDPASYHHWAILGDETWSGTVNLVGDVVVFPGATLTIEPGTVVTFSSQSDRHQFKKGNHSLSRFSSMAPWNPKGPVAVSYPWAAAMS